MIPLFNISDLNKFKPKEKLPLQCEQCGDTFYSIRKEVNKVLHNHPSVKLKYCSTKCMHANTNKTILIKCTNCNKSFNKQSHRFTENNFCSRSCAAQYNNTHKTIGNRRSKLEKYLEDQLTNQFPNMLILFNDKTAINSELDIYIPSLKLAFELNGIFHYEPIYGQEKLNQIQNNDNRKFQACIEQGIELCLIDTSQQKYFKKQTSLKYLNIIINIINERTLNI